MKNLLVIGILAAGLASPAIATRQIGELLINNGSTNWISIGSRWSLDVSPLESYLKQHNLRLYELVPRRRFSINTACWRGYIGTWEIKDGWLWLVKVNCLGEEVPLSKVFTNQSPPIKAVWFSGTLCVMGNPRANAVTAPRAADQSPPSDASSNQESSVKATWSSGNLKIEGPPSTNAPADSPFEPDVYISIRNGEVVTGKTQTTSIPESMPDPKPNFIPAHLVGLALVGVAWGLTRRRARDSWLWRLALSFVTAVMATPTVCSIYDPPGVLPAFFVTCFALPGNTGRLTHGLLHGVLPLACGIAFFFLVSTAGLRFLGKSRRPGGKAGDL